MTPAQLKKINEILVPTGTSFDEYGLNGRLQYIHRWARLMYSEGKFHCTVLGSTDIGPAQSNCLCRELREIQGILPKLNAVMKGEIK